jgi:hypothetical protein
VGTIIINAVIGLQNFNGTFLPYSTVLLKPDENGENFKGIATVPNRSVVTFEIVSTAVE